MDHSLEASYLAAIEQFLYILWNHNMHYLI
jgi:hypothetical protein